MIRDIAADLAADLACGFGLLTRLPVGWLVRPGQPYRPARAVWSYPLAGMLVGGAGALFLLLGRSLGVPPLLIAAWILTVQVLLTGGLHEDGIADFADGLGGRTPERRLAIMRDSRIGSYGALALLLSTLIRVAALATLAAGNPTHAACALLAIGGLSRIGMLPALCLQPARSDGLGHALGRVPRIPMSIGMVLTLVPAVLLLGPVHAAGGLLVSLGVGAGIALLAGIRLGGQTGDVLGTCVVLAECGLLSLAA